MLLSMTGFGNARFQDQKGSILVEVRAVNNRHLKLVCKISDPFTSLEPDLEQLVRGKIRRGSVQVSVRIERPRRPEDYRLNPVAIASYRDQLLAIASSGGESLRVGLSDLLSLPGVVEETRPAAIDPGEDWPRIAAVVNEALEKFELGRIQEGQAMADELRALGEQSAAALSKIADRGPVVVQAYQKRLTERIAALVKDHGITIDDKDLIREIAIQADRSDISEEIVRLRAHLTQYQEVIRDDESAGRKLEFVVQEMGREINTIGSKANDVEISRLVFEVKGNLEKIRELIQNVE